MAFDQRMMYKHISILLCSALISCGSGAEPESQQQALSNNSAINSTIQKPTTKIQTPKDVQEKQSGAIESDLYLSIIGTGKKSIDIALQYKSLLQQFKYVNVINSDECENLKPNLVLFINNQTLDKDSANTALSQAKIKIPDSYLRSCKPSKNALVSHAINYIDPSIAQLSGDTVNWEFEDLETKLIPLQKKHFAVLKSQFSENMMDETEGRKTQLLLKKNQSEQESEVLAHCWNFSNYTLQNELFMFQCSTGYAGMHFTNTVYAYNTKVQKIAFEQDYCQNIELKNNKIYCAQEHIDESGKLHLTQQAFSLQLN